MSLSIDNFISGKRLIEVEHYYQASAPIALYLSACFKALYPDYFQTYSEAFKAGVWVMSDPGPWIHLQVAKLLLLVRMFCSIDIQQPKLQILPFNIAGLNACPL